MPGDFVRKLDAMQTFAESSGAPTEASFTAMFSALTSRPPAQNAQDTEGPFQDDVVSLSYEQALRSATRNRPSSFVTPRADSPVDSIVQREPAVQDPVRSQQPASHRHASRSKAPKSSSVTIRLDEAEGKELRARAAEAGLTVSAYLRSCIFEVDDLRTQVKQTLAQMRTAPTPSASVPAIPLQAPSTGWRDRIFPRWTMHRTAAHA
jgi:predicted DNA binding CopG/RHH family protein